MNIKSGVYWLHNNNFSLHNIFNVDMLEKHQNKINILKNRWKVREWQTIWQPN